MKTGILALMILSGLGLASQAIAAPKEAAPAPAVHAASQAAA